MSYKDGIPLLTTFTDDNEEDFDIETPRRKGKCNRRCVLFGVILGLAVVLAIGLVVSVTLGIELKKSSEHPSGEGHGTGKTSSEGGGGPIVSDSIDMSHPYASLPSETVTSGTSPMLTQHTVTHSTLVGVSPTASSTGAGMTSYVPPISPTSSAIPLPSSVSPSGTQTSGPPSSSIPSNTQVPVISSAGPQSSSIPSNTQVPAISSTGPPSSSILSNTQVPAVSSTGPPSSAPSNTQTMSSAFTPSSAPMTYSQSPVAQLTSILPTPSVIAPLTSIAITTFTSFSMTTNMTNSKDVMTYSSASSSVLPLPTQSSSLFPSPTPSPSPLPFECSNNSSLCPSPHDDRTYSFKTLSNGLQVVLVSDPSTDLSGASMDVAAGSFNDPPDYEGLAHFCEHMLFLGTKTFPNENEYSEYLSTHGGYDNAYTSTQETNYHFRVGHSYLKHALDLFSHFFIDPLFKEEKVASELNAVNQEHQKNILSDEWKLWQLLKNISNPGHPFSQFNTGNLETLNKSGVRDALIKYYNTSYSASTMNLAVYGRENTSVLFDWVDTYFSKIKNTHVSATSYNTTAFPPSFTSKIIHYYPQASSNILTIYWQTPSLQTHHRNSIGDFISRYLGHEGIGSLFNSLKMRGLAFSLAAGTELATDSFHLFSLQITLSDRGLDSISEVVHSVFSFTHLLSNLTEADFSDKWEDFVNVNKVTFDYAEKQSPNDYAVSITKVMRVVEEPADVLPNPRRYLPDYHLTVSTASYLSPNNSLIFIGTKKVNITDGVKEQANLQNITDTSPQPMGDHVISRPILDQIEPIYDTPFHLDNISHDLLSYWNEAPSVGDLRLADANAFIPSNLSIIPPSENCTASPCLPVNVSGHWFLLDTANFPEPRVNFRCELRLSEDYRRESSRSASWDADSRVFVDLVTAIIKPILFGATEVGYTFDLTSTPRGIELSFGGLSDHVILQHIINITMYNLVNFANVKDVGNLFTLVLNSTRDKLLNYNFTTLPYRYTYHYIQSVIMDRPTWTNELVLSKLRSFILAKFVGHISGTLLTADTSVVCLAHGNVDEEITDLFVKTLTTHLNKHLDNSTPPPPPPPAFQKTRVLLQQAGVYDVSLPAFNPSDKNSVVNVIYQVGPVCTVTSSGKCSNESLLRSLHLLLLNQIIADACFTQLRTREKLGYVVFCFHKVNEGIGSFQSLVQSEEYSPERVLNSTLSFLDSFYNDTVISENFTSNFDDTRAILMASLLQRDLTLGAKTKRLWNQVVSGQYQFDYKCQQVNMVDNLNSRGFQDFYNETILRKTSRRELVIVVYGKDKSFMPASDYHIDYHLLNQANSTLPIG